MKRNQAAALLAGACLAMACGVAQAELTVEINQGSEGGIPLAVVPFGGAEVGENLGSIVTADLARSGRFKLLSLAQMPERPTAPEQIQFPVWKALGQDDLVIGQVKAAAPNHYVAQFQLFDAVRGAQLVSYDLPFETGQARKTAHRIADMIYKRLTGEDGVFDTRIAYVTVVNEPTNERSYVLQIADADGHDPQTIIKSLEPIMSPAWSPDGQKIAYVSFENHKSAIYIQTLATGERDIASELPGINGAPAWSPDGSRLALTLSKDGNPDVYVLNLKERSLRRLTEHFANDTEPAWAKDGSQIVFTSDRGGKPQLYAVAAGGGEPKRLTYEGDYNASAAFSPDGKSLAFVHGVGGNFRIAVMDLASKQMRVLTPGKLDESPGFAPNGSMVLYASRNADGEARLSAVSIDGKVRQSLRTDSGEVREPAWSP
jgi:TolB protein